MFIYKIISIFIMTFYKLMPIPPIIFYINLAIWKF
nr:MAG TPA: hypothetical protein [Caudoviricetes sp.]